MRFATRIEACFYENLSISKHRFFFLRKHFAFMFCLLLIGFVIGNIFGTFLSLLRNFIKWDGILIVCFLLIFEIVSYGIYHSIGRAFPFFRYPEKLGFSTFVEANTKVKNVMREQIVRKQDSLVLHRQNLRRKVSLKYEQPKKTFWRFANFFKIGLMIGFFIDAFKVGS